MLPDQKRPISVLVTIPTALDVSSRHLWLRRANRVQRSVCEHVRIELHFLPASSCSISMKTRKTPLLTWTWDACFYFVDMKSKALGREIALKNHVCSRTQGVFSCSLCSIYVCVGVGIIIVHRGGRSRDEITQRKTW